MVFIGFLWFLLGFYGFYSGALGFYHHWGYPPPLLMSYGSTPQILHDAEVDDMTCGFYMLIYTSEKVTCTHM